MAARNIPGVLQLTLLQRLQVHEKTAWMLRSLLEDNDTWEVVGEAETGEDSVTMANDLQPDLVLMDVNLPGINGLDATRQILTG